MTQSITTVADYLEDRRRSGALIPGGRLPTERALADLLGCSRHDVRRQLDVLEGHGRVTREVGRGTFLTGAAAGTLASPLDLIDARAAWEPNLMPLVVVTATADDFEEIRRCVDNGERAANPAEFMTWDMAFHRALAMATHNAVVVALHEMVENSRRQLAGTALDERRYSTENCTVCQSEHRVIAESVFDRDAPASQAAMRSHLETVRRQLLPDLR